VVTLEDGRLEVFARGPDNALWHRWPKKLGGAWNDWTSEGGPIHSDPAPGRNKDGRMEVFALNADGVLMHTWQQKD
jgi:Repeat of unknown function (DUF346)